MLAQIPVPIVDTLTTAGANARRLSLTSYTVAIQFGIEPYRWDPEERDNLVVETDALVAHAYGLTQIQYATILDSFEVIARMQISEYGRYKFKDDCLEAYRRIS
jgi:hypothetical protein